MRKTKIIIVTVGVLISGIVLVVNIFCCLKHTRSKDCQNNYNNNFNIKEYSSFIKNTKDSINIGAVNDFQTAKEKGVSIIKNKFGERADIYKPYKVYFDQNHKCWLVKGTLEKQGINNIKGGTPFVIFDTKGNVLALGHGK